MNVTKQIMAEIQTIAASGKTPWVATKDGNIVGVAVSRDKARALKAGAVEKFNAADVVVLKEAKKAKSERISKKTLATQLFVAAADHSRKAIIKAFGEELGMSKEMASTYYYMIRKSC